MLKNSNAIKYLLFFIDLTLPAALVYALTMALNTPWQTQYLAIALIAIFLQTLAFKLKNLYSPITEQNLFQTAVHIFYSWILIFALSTIVTFLIKSTPEVSRTVIILWCLITPFTLIVARIILKKISLKPETHILIIGNQYTFTPYERDRLQKNKTFLHALPDTLDTNELIKQINTIQQTQNIHHIVLNSNQTPAQLIRYYIQQELKGIRFYTFEHFMEKFLRKCYIPDTHQTLAYLDEIQPYNNRQKLIKAVIDYTAASLLILFTIPIMLYAAYRIKKESPGTIFFTQKRVGINNKEFTLIKFRSMHMDAEKHGAQFAQENDPRAYKFGQFMRKTRIDELPQSFNVLKGDIHFIGPRAERKIFTQKLEMEIPYYNERHLIKPGITGWAQVNYPYGANTEDARQKLMYDLYYIKYWNLALEIETAWKTIAVILNKKGL